MLVVDGVTILGTANLDYRSLRTNKEVVFATEESRIQEDACTVIESLCAESERVTKKELLALPFYEWMLSYFLFMFRRFF